WQKGSRSAGAAKPPFSRRVRRHVAPSLYPSETTSMNHARLISAGRHALPLLLAFALAACGGGSGEAPATTAASEAAAPDTAATPAARINLNTATEDEFRTIPGVGDRMVHEFVE